MAYNDTHTVQARMARWLLMTRHRAGTDSFPLTQEFLSGMLGVRRQSVMVMAGILQNAGLIIYSRGNMRILDRAGLEKPRVNVIKCFVLNSSS